MDFFVLFFLPDFFFYILVQTYLIYGLFGAFFLARLLLWSPLLILCFLIVVLQSEIKDFTMTYDCEQLLASGQLSPKFWGFLCKGVGTVGAIFGPVQNTAVFVIFCLNIMCLSKIWCFKPICLVFYILGLKVRKKRKITDFWKNLIFFTL